MDGRSMSKRNLSEGQIVPFWSVRIGESEEAQDVGVFKMRCMDMRCDDERKWATQCADWMNSHNTFGGDISPDMAYNALLAVFQGIRGPAELLALLLGSQSGQAGGAGRAAL